MLSKNKVKYIQTLYHKKQRLAENLLVVEGDKMVLGILTKPKSQIHSIYALQDWATQHKNLLNNIAIEMVTEEELSKISNLTTPNKALAIVHIPNVPPLPNPAKHWVLVLDGIQDPGNLGTIIRTADWFGVQHIVCSNETTDCYNPKVIQSTMGSLFNVTMHYTNLVDFIKKYPNVNSYFTTLNGIDLQKATSVTNGVVVIGNEGSGISEALLQLPHTAITISGKGNAESLNAAVATGIVLAHLVK